MISKKDKLKIIALARKYKVDRILLFGSSLRKASERKDIDLGVEGLKPKVFFEFYGDLMFALRKSVDLIDLSFDSKFTRLVKKEGLSIYG